ncbi:MAG: B12-binding domain-containing radical SAM protein [Deltaproteobacteria bacterium]|nr:B12-binding domain-containing radical SAM protein [Deltaproteobacteria bacterium]
MKIAFVLRNIDVAEPLGLMILSSILKRHGHDVRAFVASEADWLQQIRRYQPGLTAYSVISGNQDDYLRLNDMVKKTLETVSLFGGPHTTFFPETVHERNVDAICIGEGEGAILDLADALENGSDITGIRNLWIKTQGGVVRNDVRPLVRNLDEIAYPDREILYDKDRYLRNNKIRRFLSNRGCPFGCTYCFNRAFREIYRRDRMIRWRSVENVVSEIREVKARYPMELVRFIDDIFILPPADWLEEFARLYRKEVRLPFVCNLQVRMVKREKVRILKEAGCCAVYMAIEAGNDRIRNELLERKMTKEEIIKAFDLVHSHGISIGAENILGLPGGSLAADWETVELNTRCRVDNPISTLFQPYPKTKLGEYALAKGLFDGHRHRLGRSYFGSSPLIFSSREEKSQIENLQKLFGLAVTHPSLLPVIKALIKLPPNRLFALFHRLYDSFLKKRKIFRIPFHLKDYLLSLARVLHY